MGHYMVIINQPRKQVIITSYERSYAATEPKILRKGKNKLRSLNAGILYHKITDHVNPFYYQLMHITLKKAELLTLRLPD